MAINAALGPSELHEKSGDTHTLHHGHSFLLDKGIPPGSYTAEAGGEPECELPSKVNL